MAKRGRFSYLYVVKGDKDSEKALHLLESSKIQFKRIPVTKNGYGKFIFRDLHTTELPTLANAKTVHVGLRSIESFVRKNCVSNLRPCTSPLTES
jgi:hypothetical protein